MPFIDLSTHREVNHRQSLWQLIYYRTDFTLSCLSSASKTQDQRVGTFPDLTLYHPLSHPLTKTCMASCHIWCFITVPDFIPCAKQKSWVCLLMSLNVGTPRCCDLVSPILKSKIRTFLQSMPYCFILSLVISRTLWPRVTTYKYVNPRAT